MKTFLSSALFISIFLFSCTKPDIKFDKKLIDTWVKMWNTYDLDQIEQLFHDDATYFSSEKEGEIKGKQMLHKHHEDFGFVSGGKKQNNKLWLEDISVVEKEKATVVTAIWFFSKNDTIDPQKGPVSLVYTSNEGSYRIIHAHFANY